MQVLTFFEIYFILILQPIGAFFVNLYELPAYRQADEFFKNILIKKLAL